ncbi:hypothetical protein J1TS3_07430 [Siminovitchia fordii]|uniref:Uncharacterized protein n=1 Tax=Siminovitchia fordii TaxID=254759 RepID=A0ABQ4K1H0_9BACI|nr:hypothetical protein J1TS3_07430 [Siminovitchia fordii]
MNAGLGSDNSLKSLLDFTESRFRFHDLYGVEIGRSSWRMVSFHTL